MEQSSYKGRQEFEMEHWPPLRQKVNELLKLIFPDGAVSAELKVLVFTMAGRASGCLHCQSHGAFELNHLGVSDEKIQALWSFERSKVFTDAERAALTLALAAGGCPNSTQPEYFVELRKHFTNIQIIEIMASIAMGGFLNRWNDTIATVTDQESVDLAQQILGPVGWNAGKHTGESHEQRKAHPLNTDWMEL